MTRHKNVAEKRGNGLGARACLSSENQRVLTPLVFIHWPEQRQALRSAHLSNVISEMIPLPYNWPVCSYGSWRI